MKIVIELTKEQVVKVIEKQTEALKKVKDAAIANAEKKFEDEVKKLEKKFKTGYVDVDESESDVVVEKPADDYLKISRQIAAQLNKAKKSGNAELVAQLEAKRKANNEKFGKTSRK
jgi:intein-encoded DNA endonuclease-like protein